MWNFATFLPQFKRIRNFTIRLMKYRIVYQYIGNEMTAYHSLKTFGDGVVQYFWTSDTKSTAKSNILTALVDQTTSTKNNICSKKKSEYFKLYVS